MTTIQEAAELELATAVSNRLRAAVVGGGIGAQHVGALKELPDLYDVAAICDIDESRAQAIAAENDIPLALTDFDDLLARDDIDIIHICTPPVRHAAQITSALKSGKHVVCEKPIAGSLADIDRIAALEQETGLLVSPIFQYRFGNGMRKLLHLRDRGVLGKCYLATVETHWRRGADYYAVPWRGRFETELGGCLVSHAIHAHDLFVHALGPITSVHGRTATRVAPIETEDCAILSLEMESGTLAALSVTLGASVQHTRMRFCFEKATVQSNLHPYEPDIDPWLYEPSNEAAEREIEAALADFTPALERYAGQFSAIHAAITSGAEAPVTIADGRRSIELATAAYYSSKTGEAVSLPIGPDHPYYQGWRPK